VTKLTHLEDSLLVEVLNKAGREVLLDDEIALLRKTRDNMLSPEESEALCSLIVQELTDTGLLPDSEPTSRGLALEGLIDKVRRSVRS